MRVRDENKKDAIFSATIDLINEKGFANLSMSQIGKKAGVASSTIYVYFENKEDMLNKVYLNVGEKLRETVSRNIDQSAPIRQVMEQVIRNILDFAMEHTAAFFFLEQFANASIPGETCVLDTVKMLKPVFDVIERGQREGVLKDTEPTLQWMFCYYGTTQMIKAKLKLKQEITESEINQLVKMCWDAIKA